MTTSTTTTPKKTKYFIYSNRYSTLTERVPEPTAFIDIVNRGTLIPNQIDLNTQSQE